ncbi:BTAD domain-containing putative transcriptional regulator [Winogradskya humida]
MSMAIQFSLLGALTVTRAGAGLDLGARQQRLVLALLLARAGSPVPMDDLIGLLYDGAAPASAANVVHRHVGTLRRLLEPGLPARSGGGFISSQLSGYRLTVAGSAFDLEEFRRLTERARQEQSLDLYAQALALWRGRCAAGLEPPGRTHPAFAAVEAERARAAREAADLAEAAGQLRRILPLLAAAARERPLDQALQARLLLAYAADGRQAEAVAVYQKVTDPGPELREAYERVTTAPAPSRPAQLPPDPPFFTGRTGPLARAHRIVARADRGATTVLAIDGMPGVGKTTLAVHLAHQLAGDYPDGQLYADLRGFDHHDDVLSPGEALRGFLGSLGVPQDAIPRELHGRSGLYRSALAGRRVLIVLDNCRDTEQVRHLLPGSPGCLVVVTSRTQLTGLLTTSGAHPLPLGLPGAGEAREALERRLGPERVGREPAAAARIIEGCGRLPLALAVLSARAAGNPGVPLGRIAAELALAHGSLAGFDSTDPHTDLRAVFSWSYRALSEPAARLFRLMPLHPVPDMSIAAAAGLAGVPLRTGRALIAELERAHLITEDRPGRFRTHDLLRAYASELSEKHDPPRARAAAIAGCARFYRATAYAAHRRLLAYPGYQALGDPGPGGTPLTFAGQGDAMRWFAAEQHALTELVRRGGRRGDHADAWQLTIAMQQFFERSGRWLDWVATARTALQAAVAGGDLVGQARMHRTLAGAHYSMRRLTDAASHLDRARHLLDGLGLTGELSRARLNLAMIRRAEGRHEEAIAELSGLVGPARAAGDDKLLADALAGIAASTAELGRGTEAERLAREAMRLFEGYQDVTGLGDAWQVLGRAHAQSGDLPEAVRSWRRAARFYHEADADAPAADALAAAGDAMAAAGHAEAAGQAWGEALALLAHEQSPVSRRLRERVTMMGS